MLRLTQELCHIGSTEAAADPLPIYDRKTSQYLILALLYICTSVGFGHGADNKLSSNRRYDAWVVAERSVGKSIVESRPDIFQTTLYKTKSKMCGQDFGAQPQALSWHKTLHSGQDDKKNKAAPSYSEHPPLTPCFSERSSKSHRGGLTFMCGGRSRADVAFLYPNNRHRPRFPAALAILVPSLPYMTLRENPKRPHLVMKGSQNCTD
jgi:hypothetical protein